MPDAAVAFNSDVGVQLSVSVAIDVFLLADLEMGILGLR